MEIDANDFTTKGFAEKYLGLNLYPWQAEALAPLEAAVGPNCKRQNIAIVAPNGSGKDSQVIPAAIYWWLFYNPKGRVVVTSKSDLQLTGQTIPNVNKYWERFGWPEPTKSPRFVLQTPEGGSLTAFVTNEGNRVEGWHSMPDSPCLLIVNEAKSIEDKIFEGINRCRVSAFMMISSPGLKMGQFYHAFEKMRDQYTPVRAGLADCPHIKKEDVELVISTYGEHHPVTRSTLFGEFMSQSDEEPYVLTLDQVESCINNPPQHQPGFKYGFFDFAEGRAENALVIRDGNKFQIADAWRESNADAVIGRAIQLLRKHGLTAANAGGDAAAKYILDGLAQAGYPIHRQNFGSQVSNQVYKSWSAYAWLEGAQKITKREVILPDDETLIGQLVTRKKEFAVTGKLGVEEKYQMNKRGIKSPDRADALFGCMAAVDTRAWDTTQRQTFREYIESEQDGAELLNCVGL